MQPRRTSSLGDRVEFDIALGHLAAFGAKKIGNGFQGRRLAGTVGAEEGNDAPFGNLEGNALQHENHAIVNDLDIVDGQNRIHTGFVHGRSPLLVVLKIRTYLHSCVSQPGLSATYLTAASSSSGRTASRIGSIQSDAFCWM